MVSGRLPANLANRKLCKLSKRQPRAPLTAHEGIATGAAVRVVREGALENQALTAQGIDIGSSGRRAVAIGAELRAEIVEHDKKQALHQHIL